MMITSHCPPPPLLFFYISCPCLKKRGGGSPHLKWLCNERYRRDSESHRVPPTDAKRWGWNPSIPLVSPTSPLGLVSAQRDFQSGIHGINCCKDDVTRSFHPPIKHRINPFPLSFSFSLTQSSLMTTT